MIYSFDTDDRREAVAALCVYVCWRSRDMKRFKITPEVWSQVERFTRASAKRAKTIPDFLEKMKPMLMVGTLNPRWMKVGMSGDIPMVVTDDGMRIQVSADDEDRREFLSGVVRESDQKAVLRALNQNSAWIVMLVRDRLEREKPIEKRFHAAFEADDVIDMEVV